MDHGLLLRKCAAHGFSLPRFGFTFLKRESVCVFQPELCLESFLTLSDQGLHFFISALTVRSLSSPPCHVGQGEVWHTSFLDCSGTMSEGQDWAIKSALVCIPQDQDLELKSLALHDKPPHILGTGEDLEVHSLKKPWRTQSSGRPSPLQLWSAQSLLAELPSVSRARAPTYLGKSQTRHSLPSVCNTFLLDYI